MNKIIFSLMFLFSSMALAAPETLTLGGDSTLKKSNYIVTMELTKVKETSKYAAYKGKMMLVSPDGIKETKVEMTFRNKKSKVRGFTLLKGTIWDGEGLEMDGIADLNALKVGSSFTMETRHMEYYMFPHEYHPPNGEQYRRRLLDKGVTTIEVME